MCEIRLKSVGVVGEICTSEKNIEKILRDPFTQHYLPELEITTELSDVRVIEDKNLEKKANVIFPVISLNPNVEHRSYVVSVEYLLERARQEMFDIYTINSSSAELDCRGILFYGTASNLGKSTFTLALSENGFNHFSDEKTLINLVSQEMVSGSRSIPLRKEILKKKLGGGDYKKINYRSSENPKLSLIISPHYDHGLKTPIINELEPLDLFWGINGDFSRRIRGGTKFIDNFSYQLPSIDSEDLTERRLYLTKKLANSVRGFYFQGDSNQLVKFVRENLK